MKNTFNYKLAPGDTRYEDASESFKAVLTRGMEYLAAKGISEKTVAEHGIQFSSVDLDLIHERLGIVEEKWAYAVVAIWFPCLGRDGTIIGWQAEAVPGN